MSNNFFNKIFFLLYSLLFLVTPLLMYDKTSELFEFNKMLFIYLTASIIVFFWLIKMIIYKKIIFRRTFLDVPIIFFLASQIISSILSIDPHTSFFGYYGRFNGGLLSTISYIILFYAFLANFDKKDLEKLFGISLISSFLVILWGLPGHFGHDLTCWLFTKKLENSCWTAQFRPSERMFSTLGQPNWLGAYLSVNFFVGVYFYLKGKSKNIKSYLIIGYLFLSFAAILFTRSRSALMAVLFSIFIFTAVIFRQLPKTKKNLALLLLIPFLSILIFKTGIPKVDKFLSFSTSTHNVQSTTLNNNAVTESFDIRRIVWKGGILLGLKYPLFGSGVETFAYGYYFVRPVAHNLTSEWDFVYNKAHNEFINFFATSGFIGFTLYCIFILSVFYFSLNSYKAAVEKKKKLLILALISSYTTILITNFFGFSTTSINIYFYLIPALIINLVSPAIVRLPDTKKKFTRNQKILFFIPVFILISGIYFVTTYFLADMSYAKGDFYIKNGDYEKARTYIKRALIFKREHVYEDRLSATDASLAFIKSFEPARDQKQVKDFIAESDYYNIKALKSTPRNVIYWKTRGKNYYIFYQITANDQLFMAAANALSTAAALAPTDPKIYYSQALLYLAKYENSKEKNADSAFKSAKEAVDAAIAIKPDYRDAYFIKGLLYKKSGKKGPAREAFQYILKNINPKDAEVIDEIKGL